MPKRQSADISPSASARSRSTIESSPATSFGLVLWGRTQPLSAHCFKLIFASNHEQSRLAKHCGDEMLASLPAFQELLRSQDVRIDLAAQLRGNARQQFAELPQTDCPYHHQVHVAARFAVTAGQRTEYESQPNSGKSKCFSQHVCQAAGLEDYVTNIRIERVLGIGVVISPVPVSPRLDNSESGESLELLPDCSICQSGPAFDLPNVQLSVSRTEQQTEDFRLHSRREQFGQRVHMRVYTTQLRGFTTQLGLMTHCDIRIPRGSTRSSYRLDIMVLTAQKKQRLT